MICILLMVIYVVCSFQFMLECSEIEYNEDYIKSDRFLKSENLDKEKSENLDKDHLPSSILFEKAVDCFNKGHFSETELIMNDFLQPDSPFFLAAKTYLFAMKEEENIDDDLFLYVCRQSEKERNSKNVFYTLVLVRWQINSKSVFFRGEHVLDVIQKFSNENGYAAFLEGEYYQKMSTRSSLQRFSRSIAAYERAWIKLDFSVGQQGIIEIWKKFIPNKCVKNIQESKNIARCYTLLSSPSSSSVKKEKYQSILAKKSEEGNVVASGFLFLYNKNKNKNKSIKNVVNSKMMTKSLKNELLLKAALEDPFAIFVVGMLYNHGWGHFDENKTQSFALLKKAEQMCHYPPLLLELSKRYFDTGEATEKVYAVNLLKKAVNLNYIPALLKLAKVYTESDSSQCLKKAFLLYSRAAEQGYEEAQYCLGQMYDKGQGTTQNILKATYWYKKSAKKNFAAAQNALGEIIMKTNGRKVKYKKAFKLFLKASYQSYPEASNNLGKMYQHGLGDLQKSEQYATTYFERAAQQGCLDAMYNLGKLYDRYDPPRYWSKALTYYQLAAEAGHGKSLYRLACMYEKGIGFLPDTKKANELLILSAEKGLRIAQHRLAVKYLGGIGLEKDREKALKYFTLAAKSGYVPSQYKLGWIYLNGCGVAKDEKEAFRWFYKASQNHYIGAQYRLAWMYSQSSEMKRNEKKAMQWFKLSASGGHIGAQFQVGWRYILGQGVRPNSKRAIEWLKRASQNGHAGSKYVLGIIYEKGIGTDNDMHQALSYYNEASNLGHRRAKEKLSCMYTDQGVLPTKDNKKYIQWLRESAYCGSVEAQYRLAGVYRQSFEKNKIVDDLNEARIWYFKAAINGHIASLNALCKIYKESSIINKKENAWALKDLKEKFGKLWNLLFLDKQHNFLKKSLKPKSFGR